MKPRIAPLTGAAIAALGVLNVWLLTLVILEEDPRAHESYETVKSVALLPEISSVPFNPKPASAYTETLVRPVFYKSRVPFVPPAPPAPEPVKPPPAPPPMPVDPGLVLGGVAIDGVFRKAYILNKANREGTWVTEGETFMGWTVYAVDSEGAKLRQSGKDLTLELYPKVLPN